MTVSQEPITFTCRNEWLVGIVSRPAAPHHRGVLILVGGPQYRVGSHRQFALLTEHLARSGVPAMRFDCRGMGDSTGDPENFERVDVDLRAALDAFFSAVKDLRDVVIWGLCDAASAATLFAHRDRRVSGLVLLNPWVRTDTSEARAYLQHYYARRLITAEPWRKLVRGELDLHATLGSIATTVRRAVGGGGSKGAARNAEDMTGGLVATLPDRMAYGIRRFKGPVLLILSGNDLTAREFSTVAERSPQWRRLLDAPRVTKRFLPEATHTFSSRAWRDRVAGWTASWVRSW